MVGEGVGTVAIPTEHTCDHFCLPVMQMAVSVDPSALEKLLFVRSLAQQGLSQLLMDPRQDVRRFLMHRVTETETSMSLAFATKQCPQSKIQVKVCRLRCAEGILFPCDSILLARESGKNEYLNFS